MDQIQLLDVAKKQQGLTSDNQLALRLGIRRERISDIRAGRKPLDEAEIFMLADMAGIDPHIAAAAARKDREKNPAKRAYWEKISMQFATALILVTVIFTGFAPEAKAGTPIRSSINYAKYRKRKTTVIRWFESLMYELNFPLPQFPRIVNV